MRPFEILDVFTATPLAGNPLAVVYDADGLTADRMQAIAAEFNLSETIFMFAPEGGVVPARIFTPREEMPFAGHPTIGGAIALAQRLAVGEVSLKVPAGRVDVSVTGGAVRRATLVAPVLPRAEPLDVPAADLARLIGVAADDIETGAYRPVRMTSGPWFTAIPLRDVAALAKAGFASQHEDVLGDAPRAVYCVTREGTGYRARMFAPTFGIVEDPATGSAAVAFAALALLGEGLGDGTHRLAIRQGVEMGRPSDIGIEAIVAAGGISRVTLSGEAVVVADGRLRQ